MDLGLDGKSAIVCASSRGLGFACARALAREGARVVLNGRDGAALEHAASRLMAEGCADMVSVTADLDTPEGRAALFAACAAPDILITNNAGPPPRPIEALAVADTERALAMNLLVPFDLMQRALPSMAARGFGRIVNITSVAVLMPLGNLEASSAARAGLSALAVGLARRYAPFGITINNLLPGMFETARLRGVLAAAAARDGIDEDAAKARRLSAIPVARLGDPDEFGALCAFLASPRAGYVTGQNILIDGGLYDRNF
jgi:3-oxoacyl-[acyl-carrier protein] reductase